MKTAIIGVGAMGGAIAEGLIKSGSVAPTDLAAANPHTDKLKHLADMGVSLTTDNCSAAVTADIVIVAVKPWLAEQVVRQISTVLTHQCVVSVMAGVSGAQIEEWLGGADRCPQLAIVIPNTAARVCASMTFVAPYNASAETVGKVKQLFDAIGSTIVTDERHLAAGMVLASCGTAFAMRYIRAAAEGGVELGFKADVAAGIVAQTVAGAARLLLDSGNHPEAEIDKVTTAGGTTIRGLNAMEQSGFTAAVISGLKAAAGK